jgi:hypothetical protein
MAQEKHKNSANGLSLFRHVHDILFPARRPMREAIPELTLNSCRAQSARGMGGKSNATQGKGKVVLYRIEYHRGGILRKVAFVAAEEKGLVGDYHRGKPYGPVPDDIADSLPQRARAAFWRGANGWHTVTGWRYDLERKRDGAPIGTVFATPIWESFPA